MEFKYTKHQVARGTKPDAEIGDKLYLIKRVSILHATYQIRLLTYLAATQNKKLIIKVPIDYKKGNSFKQFLAENKNVIKVEKY